MDAYDDLMNANLETQYTVAVNMTFDASRQQDIGMAKFAVGILVGILVASLPDEEAHALFRVTADVAVCNDMNQVLDCAAMLVRRGSDIF